MNQVQYCAFGDESVGDRWVVYSIFGVRPNFLSKALKEIKELKKRAKLSVKSKIHAKELWNGSERARNPSYKTLTFDSVKILFEDLAQTVRRLKTAGCRYTSFAIDRSRTPASVPMPGEPNISVPLGEKQLVAMAFSLTAGLIQKQLPIGSVDVWVDPDQTLVLMGKKRKKAVDLTTVIDMDKKFELVAKPGGDKQRPFLDIADFLAYIIRKSRESTSPKDLEFFNHLIQIIQPQVAEMEWGKRK